MMFDPGSCVARMLTWLGLSGIIRSTSPRSPALLDVLSTRSASRRTPPKSPTRALPPRPADVVAAPKTAVSGRMSARRGTAAMTASKRNGPPTAERARPSAAVSKPKVGSGRHTKRAVKRSVTSVPPTTRLVRVRALDPCARCGPGTSVEQLYRVDEQVAGTATVHLVFFDRHGWYCVHGASCAAVRDVHAELKAQRAGAGRRR